MEFLNQIELRGVVGNARLQTVSNDQYVNFSLLTEHTSQDSHGTMTIETLWLSVTAWKSKVGVDLSTIGKGSHVYVKGRLRARRYANASGENRTLYEVVASHVEALVISNTI